jgi:drug/metabolite transporter (DMT)-like permease
MLCTLDILGNMFLVKSLSSIDLSVFGPMNAYKPFFALIVFALLLSEIPSAIGIVGVCVIES